MPTVELIEEPTKKRKIEDVEEDEETDIHEDNDNDDDDDVKEPDHKKIAKGDGVAAVDDNDAAANEDIKEGDSMAVDASNDAGGDVTADDTGAAADPDTTEPSPSEDVDADQTKATTDDAVADADNEDPKTPAKETEDEDEVIVVGTKTHPVTPHDPSTVAAAVAAATTSNEVQATPNGSGHMVPSAATNNTNEPPTPLENGIPFPKLDEASMSGMSQSERKRYREKKRRSEITQAIDKLTKVLLKVEPANLFSQNNLVYSTNTSDLIPSRSGSGRAGGGSGQQPLNRTEIINHAVKVLEKLHRENEERKMQLMRLHTVVTDASANGAVAAAAAAGQQPATMMMMPAQPLIYQPSPQAKMPTAAFPTATAIPVQAVPTIQMQHPASYLQTATAYHVSSSGAPVDTMPKGMVMVPATASATPVPTTPAGAHVNANVHAAAHANVHHVNGHPTPHAMVPGDGGASQQQHQQQQQQQRAFEQFYMSQQQQMMGQQQQQHHHHPQHHRPVGKM